MRAGFLAGAAFAIGAIAGTFVIAPIVNRQPQTVVPQAAVPPTDPFQNARTKGDAAMDAGRCEDAVAAYERALSIRFDAGTATDLGICQRQLGRREQAVAAFEFVTLKEPSHWQARYNLTAMLLELGRVDEARKSFEILKTQRPNDDTLRVLEQTLAKHP
ncbi:MAG: Anaphase-promoting complex, cyclosome, subunit 3 [Thermoanaerobaculia bacterium]|jgi:Flp pilus assembly protein TadD|nr:Anaphase-promoting complex, cyclosome, subunit 3 [Thermoanaerobaculia bacterium]